VTSITERTAEDPSNSPRDRLPTALMTVRVFLVAFAILLAGYMFLGRGFAHLGQPPVYVGEVVLVLGLIAAAYAMVRLRLPLVRSRVVWLLLAFMALGVVRTVPYVGVYGFDSLRDGVIWGYAFFALIVYVLADRTLVLGSLRRYGWVVPVFAFWLPISWNIFAIEYQSIDLNKLGSFHPLVYFKSGDMAVHIAGSIAFLVLGTSAITTANMLVWRSLVAAPLIWTAFAAGTSNRGAILTVAISMGALALLAGILRRSRNWLPVLAASAVLLVTLAAPGLLGNPGPLTPTPSPVAITSEAPTSAANPTFTPSPTPVSTSSATPAPALEPEPTPYAGRQTSVDQLLENFISIFKTSSVERDEGSKAFRLAWWTKIVDYTVFGPYFWTGKGFGVNLADDDGFQATGDGSLRAPHNSHITVLAHMGVPGLVLWVLLQGAFGIGLLRSIWAHRRTGDLKVAAVGGWILVYWSAMMVNTSFDPYLEGPQGGIWFWTLFGLGLVVMRLTPRRRET